MKKYIPIYLYGTIIILEGVFLLFSENSTFKIIKTTLVITLTIAAIISFVAAFLRRNKQVQYTYHKIHAGSMLVYVITILFYCNTIEKLISITTILFLFYAFSEITLCNWLFNLSKKIVFKIVIVRILLGILIGVGTVIALNYSNFTWEIFGVLFIIVGTNIILYVPVMKDKESIITKELPE